MRRTVPVYIAWLLLLALVVVPAPVARAQSPGIQILVDGQQLVCSPGAYIFNNRTMVPLRFIMEAPGVGGQIGWDGATRRVSLQHNGHQVVLTIDSKRAYIDGSAVTLDVAPVIRYDRTFVPLRFIAENLGAVVGWSDLSQQAIVNFKVRPEVWGYYYYSGKDELRSEAGKVTDVVFRWLQTDGQGNISYEYQDDYSGVLALASQLGYRRHVSVMLFDPDQLHQLFSDPDNRANFINNMRAIVNQYPVEGINLDLEMMRPSDRDGYIALCRELKAAFPNLMVTAAVMAHTGNENWAQAFDYQALGQILDRVMIMAYDEHYAGSDPGAVAPYYWVKQVVNYALSQMPASKLMLGLPGYGYAWPDGGQGRTFDQSSLNRIVNNGLPIQYGFSYSDYTPYLTYQENGTNFQVWYESYQSLNEKWDLALTNQLSGVFFWKMGGEFDALNQVFPSRS